MASLLNIEESLGLRMTPKLSWTPNKAVEWVACGGAASSHNNTIQLCDKAVHLLTTQFLSILIKRNK